MKTSAGVVETCYLNRVYLAGFFRVSKVKLPNIIKAIRMEDKFGSCILLSYAVTIKIP